MHPILRSLLGTEYEWLHSMLYAFNEGSLGKFESLVPYLEREVSLSCRVWWRWRHSSLLPASPREVSTSAESGLNVRDALF